MVLTVGLMLAVAAPAYAAGGPTINGVISNLTDWLVGILAGVATLFLTIGGLRYLTAGGDPGPSREGQDRPQVRRDWLRPGRPRPAHRVHPGLGGRRLMNRAVPMRLLRWRRRHPRLLLATGGPAVVLALAGGGHPSTPRRA